MSDLLQEVPKILERRGPWPAGETDDTVAEDNDGHIPLPENDATLRVRPELHPSSPGGYNPYWDLPPA